MNKCLNCGIETANNKFCSISCQNKFQNTEKSNAKFGLFKEFTVKCERCGKEFTVNEREKLFPQKEKYFCSRSCANSRTHSDETKEKIGETLIKWNIDNKIKKNNKNIKKQKKKQCVKTKYYCKNCGKEFEDYRKKRIYCSKSCCAEWRNVNEKIGNKGGLASCKVQSCNRRSKNEIYFSELCKQKFNKVLTNEPMFNGWDADVIVEDIKTAILWNGKWHYEKITKKHSVEQVQNRDKIKIKEIEGRGYKVYIIKDMGKYKKEFVENEFIKFLLSLQCIPPRIRTEID